MDKFMRDLENIGVLHGWGDFMEDSAESTDEEQESKERGER